MILTRDTFRLAGVSLPGTKRTDGAPCEDAHFWKRSSDGFVIAVCDGAGSRSHSALGAPAVSRAVGELLLANADEVMARRLGGDAVLSVARSVLDGEAGRWGGVPDDYACTLVALLVHRGELMTCHVGDGAIYVLESEHPRVLSGPERRGRATTFVTSSGAVPRMWSRRLEPWMTGFLVVSDGADSLANQVTGEVSSLVTALVTQLDVIDDLGAVDCLADAARTKLLPRTDDDVTVVAARRDGAAGRFGCPHCRGQDVHLGWNTKRTAYFGKCRSCSQILLYTHDLRMAAARVSGSV